MMHRRQIIWFQLQMQLNIQRYILHFSFICSICTFEYNHLIKSRVEGQKVASHETTKGEGEGVTILLKSHSTRNTSGFRGMEGFSPQMYVCNKITYFNSSNLAQRQQTHICCKKFVGLCCPGRIRGSGGLDQNYF